MSFIERINENSIPRFVNREDTVYKALFGQSPFTPNATILTSSDYNCGALCDELEFADLSLKYFTNSMALDSSGGLELDDLINTFIKLPRRGSIETDASYRSRFKAIVTDKTYTKRTNKWSIIKAISYFVAEDKISVIEWFDTKVNYFELRVVGVISYINTMFLDSSYLDNSYVGGVGAGPISTFITEIIQRIKSAGIDFNVYFVVQESITTNIDLIVGSVIKTFSIAAVCKNSGSTTTTIASTVA